MSFSNVRQHRVLAWLSYKICCEKIIKEFFEYHTGILLQVILLILSHAYLSECKLLPSFLFYSFKLQNNYKKDDTVQQTINSMESIKLDIKITVSNMTMIMFTYIASLTQLNVYGK